MHSLFEAPGVGVSEGQQSRAVMGGTPLSVRVGAARGEAHPLSPPQSHGGCASSRATLASS